MATWTRVARNSVSSVQATTETAPSTESDVGMDLDQVGAFDVQFECDSGQTFTSTDGTFEAYRLHDDGLWSRHYSNDVVLTADDISRRKFSRKFTVDNPRGRIAHIAVGIVVSGGGITLRYWPTSLRGGKV